MSKPRIMGEQVWCPLCNEYAQLVRISNAARLVDVHRRTIYRYIEEGLVHAVKVAGKSYRVLQWLPAKAGPLTRRESRHK